MNEEVFGFRRMIVIIAELILSLIHIYSERIKEGNIVPLMTGDGQRVNASVVEIKPDIVVVDLNHPLAGADLIFEGEILESRPATNEEIQELVKMMSGGDGCGCGCDSCGDGCGDDCGCEGGHCH